MAANVYYEADADPSIIRGRKVAVIGYLQCSLSVIREDGARTPHRDVAQVTRISPTAGPTSANI